MLARLEGSEADAAGALERVRAAGEAAAREAAAAHALALGSLRADAAKERADLVAAAVRERRGVRAPVNARRGDAGALLRRTLLTRPALTLRQRTGATFTQVAFVVQALYCFSLFLFFFLFSFVLFLPRRPSARRWWKALTPRPRWVAWAHEQNI